MPYHGQHKDSGREWKIGLFCAPCEAPCFFCYYCFCPCLGAKQQRERLIEDGPYYCCAGSYPCCCLKEECPRVCLWCEVCCCLGMAIPANRYLLQERLRIRNSAADNCLICCGYCLECFICLCECIGHKVDQRLKNCIDWLICCLTGCMQTQQQVEMDAERIGKHHHHGPAPQIMQSLGFSK